MGKATGNAGHCVPITTGKVRPGIALFGFTLSCDEFARTLLTAGSSNTLPLEIFGMTTRTATPVPYAPETLTTLVSFAVIVSALAVVRTVTPKRGARTGAQRTGNPNGQQREAGSWRQSRCWIIRCCGTS
jgi:hypothetical protein